MIVFKLDYQLGCMALAVCNYLVRRGERKREQESRGVDEQGSRW
jgi:hypothetical protein